MSKKRTNYFYLRKTYIYIKQYNNNNNNNQQQQVTTTTHNENVLPYTYIFVYIRETIF